MASRFPQEFDRFANPTGTTDLDTSAFWTHGQQHSDLNDAVEAMQRRIGKNNSANVPNAFDIFPPWDLANVSGGVSAGLTVSVDTEVLFAGRPTLRIDVPAGTSGSKVLLGTTLSTAYIPDGWDLKNLCCAIRCTNTAIFPSVAMYVGDATYTNYWLKDKTKEGHPDGYSFPNRNNEWCFLKCGSSTAPAAIGVGGGSPVVSRRMRAKIASVLTSSASAESIWIGFFGILPPRPKPTVIITLDDGYATHYNFLAPLCRYYNIPVSLGIIGGLLGVGNKMTVAQAQALAQDSSRLFDLINHTYNHTTLVAGVNEGEQLADFQLNASYLRDTIGVSEDGPQHVVYPGGVTSFAQYAGLKAAGFLTGRKNQICWMHGQDQTLATGEDDGRFVQNIITTIEESSRAVSDVKTSVGSLKTRNEVGVLEGHNFASASGTNTWSYENMEELMAWLYSERAAGNLEIKSLSRWWADLTKRACNLL